MCCALKSWCRLLLELKKGTSFPIDTLKGIKFWLRKCLSCALRNWFHCRLANWKKFCLGPSFLASRWPSVKAPCLWMCPPIRFFLKSVTAFWRDWLSWSLSQQGVSFSYLCILLSCILYKLLLSTPRRLHAWTWCGLWLDCNKLSRQVVYNEAAFLVKVALEKWK